MFRALGLVAILSGATIVAMDPTRLPGVATIGKAAFAVGVVMAALPGIRNAPGRVFRPELLAPLTLVGWIWVSAVIGGRPAHLMAAAELTLPILTMVLVAVQRWSDFHTRVATAAGTCFLLVVALSGVPGFRPLLNQGAFGHPNGFGGTLLFLSIFPVLALTRGALLTRSMAALVIALGLLMVATSSSRGSLIACALFAGLLVYLRSGRVLRFSSVSLGIMTITALLLVIQTLSAAELDMISFDLFGKRVDTGRLAMWTLLVGLVLDRPVFGYGPGGSFREFNEGLSAHSVYLQTLFDAGFPALVLLVGSLALILLVLRRKCRESPGDKVAVTGFAFVLAIAMHGLIEVSWMGNFLPGTFVFWPFVGLMLSRARWSERGDGDVAPAVAEPAPQPSEQYA